MAILRGIITRKGGISFSHFPSTNDDHHDDHDHHQLIPSHLKIIENDGNDGKTIVVLLSSTSDIGMLWSVIGERFNLPIVKAFQGFGSFTKKCNDVVVVDDAVVVDDEDDEDKYTSSISLVSFPYSDSLKTQELCPILSLSLFNKASPPIPLSLMKSIERFKKSLKGLISSSYFDNPSKYYQFLQKIMNQFPFYDKEFILSCWIEHSSGSCCKMCSSDTFFCRSWDEISKSCSDGILVGECIIKEKTALLCLRIRNDLKEEKYVDVPLLMQCEEWQKQQNSKNNISNSSLIVIFSPSILNIKTAAHTMIFLDGTIRRISSIVTKEQTLTNHSSIVPFRVEEINKKETFTYNRKDPLLVRMTITTTTATTNNNNNNIKNNNNNNNTKTIEVPLFKALFIQPGSFVVPFNDSIYLAEFKTSARAEKRITKTIQTITFYNFYNLHPNDDGIQSQPPQSLGKTGKTTPTATGKTINVSIEDIYYQGPLCGTFSSTEMIGLPYEKMLIRCKRQSGKRKGERCIVEINNSPHFRFPFQLFNLKNDTSAVFVFSGLRRKSIRADGTKVFETITSSPCFSAECISNHGDICAKSTTDDPPHHYLYEGIKEYFYYCIGRFVKIISITDEVQCQRCNSIDDDNNYIDNNYNDNIDNINNINNMNNISNNNNAQQQQQSHHCIIHRKERKRKIRAIFSDGTGEIVCFGDLLQTSLKKGHLDIAHFYKVLLDNTTIKDIEQIPTEDQAETLLDSLRSTCR